MGDGLFLNVAEDHGREGLRSDKLPGAKCRVFLQQ